jgi:hypothetical protein
MLSSAVSEFMIASYHPYWTDASYHTLRVDTITQMRYLGAMDELTEAQQAQLTAFYDIIHFSYTDEEISWLARLWKDLEDDGA